MTTKEWWGRKRASRSPFVAVALGIAIQLARFGVIVGALAVAPMVGVSGWYAGLFANVACVLFAVALVTVLGLWRGSGSARWWRSPLAALWLLPFVLEGALRFALPGGIEVPPPGIALWTCTLLLASLNEELVNRVAVLGVLGRTVGPTWSAVASAALFGLAHLSLLVTTPTRTADDILLNVLASAAFGFALAAFQIRFRWVLSLVLVHAFANASVIFTEVEMPFVGDVAIHAAFVLFGILLLRTGQRGTVARRNDGVLTRQRTE
ncbi:CPBP family intramembrane glutamic endopeptidase [Microbacterium halophytorum]|uniref:CPBP family intramembrane glutamic endopeptidase n=1 Tax=Microbacterium halophytorum TaxID=2067568 RepID=UPI001319E7D6|nr:CPBP family intramembrane glutamic endopeptidase [Microbacterium halophytorum]